MTSDFEGLLEIFNANEVKYLIEAGPRRSQANLGAQPAAFIGREDLLKNKRTTSRHIDLHDAGLLE